MNHYRERIKKIDKNSKTAVCPVCSEDEDWEHVILWEKSKENREEWEKTLDKKLKEVEWHVRAEEE